jgi:hypothetical protein
VCVCVCVYVCVFFVLYSIRLYSIRLPHTTYHIPLLTPLCHTQQADEIDIARDRVLQLSKAEGLVERYSRKLEGMGEVVKQNKEMGERMDQVRSVFVCGNT